ncbi:hypothetical protein C2W62_35300 [Candidatus Entotheonella serta]|nr:hypothetical protein C2W62_35300 [Candidatus Entotheonella serta]
MAKKSGNSWGQPLPEAGHNTGRSMADILVLSDELRRLVQWMLRSEAVEIKDVMTYMGTDEETARSTLETLVETGFVKVCDISQRRTYQVCLITWLSRQSSQKLWQTLGKKLEE